MTADSLATHLGRGQNCHTVSRIWPPAKVATRSSRHRRRGTKR